MRFRERDATPVPMRAATLVCLLALESCEWVFVNGQAAIERGKLKKRYGRRLLLRE